MEEEDLPPAPSQSEAALTGDYSNVKIPPNQTATSTFWAYCEPYFRNITEKDLADLEDHVSEIIS